jgi:hypothetical protein
MEGLICTVMHGTTHSACSSRAGDAQLLDTETELNHTSSLKSHMVGLAIILAYPCRLGECNTGKNAPT